MENDASLEQPSKFEPLVLFSYILAEQDTYLRDCRCARALRVLRLDQLYFGTSYEVPLESIRFFFMFFFPAK